MNKIKAAARLNQPVTDEVLARAIERGKGRKNSGVHATSVSYASKLQALLVGFADQSAVMLPVKNYPELRSLSSAELKAFEIGFGGAALCLERRDLHISIAGLVAASRSLMAMANTVVAAHHGRRSSKAKAAASRENGRKGGRPRKHAAAASA
jgi:hypothetical protein